MRRRVLSAATVVALACATTACHGQSHSPATATGPGYTVTVGTGANAPTTALVGADGGTVTAEANGITYTLTVPANALLADTAITLTPIASVGNYPFAKDPGGGVALGPAGLVLSAPALLEITGGPARDGTMAWAYDGTGAGFHLVPYAAQTGIVIPVLHFSGAGYGPATAAEAAALPAPPNQVDAALQDGARDQAGSGTDWAAQAKSWIKTATAAADRDVAAAMDNPGELGPAAVAERLAVERFRQLVGDDDPDADAAVGRFWEQLTKMEDKLKAQLLASCKDKTKNPASVVKSVLSLIREQALRGVGTVPTMQQTMAELKDCFAYKLTVDVAADIVGWDIHYFHSADTPKEYESFHLAASHVELKLVSAGDGAVAWTGDVPLEMTNFKTNTLCFTGLISVPEYSPVLHVSAVANINPVRSADGGAKPGQAAAGPFSATDTMVVTAELDGVVEWAWPVGPNSPCSGSDAESFTLSEPWAAANGGAPHVLGFGGGSFTVSAHTAQPEWVVNSSVVLTASNDGPNPFVD